MIETSKNPQQANAILVIGGTGKTGRRVVERLKARGLPVRIGSREGDPPFVWENPETWAEAIDGIDTVYITFQPDLAVPGARKAIEDFTFQAVRGGIQKVVLLSGRDYVWLINYFFTEVLVDRNAIVTNDIEKVLGRKAKDFSEYAKKTATIGIWNPDPI